MSAPANATGVSCQPLGNNGNPSGNAVKFAVTKSRKSGNTPVAAASAAVTAAATKIVPAAPAAPAAEGATKPAPLAASEESSESVQLMNEFAVKIAPFATIIAKADTPMNDINTARVEFNKVLAEFNAKSKGNMPLLPDTVTADNLEEVQRLVASTLKALSRSGGGRRKTHRKKHGKRSKTHKKHGKRSKTHKKRHGKHHKKHSKRSMKH